MPTLDSLTDYLLDRGLIELRDVIDGDLDITSITRRNANFHVNTRGGGLLIKERAGRVDIAPDSLRTEARFYRYCHQTEGLETVARRLPRLHHEDAERQLLAIEWLDETQPLWRVYRERSKNDFPAHLTASIGELLADLHRARPRFGDAALPDFLHSEPPWALDLDRPSPSKLAHITAAYHELIRLLQSEPAVARTLASLRAAWPQHAGSTLVHGDVKLDNFLVRDAGDVESSRVFLVDWEMAVLGDPAWDVGSAFQDFIFWWVLGMAHDRPPEQMVETAKYPLADLQPGIRALWSAYSGHRRFDVDDSAAFLDRAVLYAGARLLQTSAEIASKYQRLPAPSALLAQIGVNLCRRPEVARRDLLGLAPADETLLEAAR